MLEKKRRAGIKGCGSGYGVWAFVDNQGCALGSRHSIADFAGEAMRSTHFQKPRAQGGRCMLI